MDKKGGEKILSFWWIFVTAIVVVAVVAGVSINYSRDIDARQAEAEILNQKLASCFQGKDVLGEFDVYESCGLNKEIFEAEESEIFFRISFYNGLGEKVREDIYGGNSALELDCGVEELGKKDNFPECSEKFFSSSFGKIKILTASKDSGRRLA